MNDDSTLVGMIATSLAGRDKGRSFIITQQCDPNHVLLVDGTLRRLERPKRKKLKHLRLENVVVEGLKEKIVEKKQVFNAQIRNCLLSHGFNHDRISEEE